MESSVGNNKINNKSTWTRRIAIIICIVLTLLLVILENTCLFGKLHRRVVVVSPRKFFASENVRVEEIPLDDVESMERRAIARVQLVPLWNDNDTNKVPIFFFFFNHSCDIKSNPFFFYFERTLRKNIKYSANKIYSQYVNYLVL